MVLALDRPQPELARPFRHAPVIFVVVLMAGLYAIYVFVHGWWMVQPETPRDTGRELRGYLELAIFHLVTIMVVICYIRSLVTGPGAIPDDDEWCFRPMSFKHRGEAFVPRGGRTAAPAGLHETKKSGERRYCKWCEKHKPDRCHHCRVCRTCVLKMDHHCPWICNCVGFRNHKYFFLLVFYATIDCHLITWTMLESAKRALDVETEFVKMFLVIFGYCVALLLALMLTGLLVFHAWLAASARTTIEFCEQKSKAKSGGSAWDQGLFANVKAALGPSVFLWFLPVSPPEGDGLVWHATERTRLTDDLEVDRQHARRGGLEAARWGARPASDLETPLPSPRPAPRAVPRSHGTQAGAQPAADLETPLPSPRPLPRTVPGAHWTQAGLLSGLASILPCSSVS